MVGNNSNLEIFNRIKETNSNNADEYSNSKTYVKDEYCIYNNTLYKANQAIDTAEEFTESHWTETTVGTELKSQADSISALNSRMAAFPDFNNVLKSTFDVNETWEATANCWIIGYLRYDESQGSYDTNITRNNDIIASCYSASGRLYTPVCFPLKSGTSIRTSEAGTFAIRAYACES